MVKPQCFVCGTLLGEALYQSPARSLTSLCQIHPTPTTVHACGQCGHLQSEVISEVDAYYDEDYDILIASDEEDQVYEVQNGEPIYRTAHQVDTLLTKLVLGPSIDLLDYGCAKSSTIRALCEIISGVTPHLFDVSSRYVSFWEKFVAPGNWAVDTTPPNWNSRFDVVTSFFSLEHIPDPRASMRHIASLLKEDGIFYCVVPNVITNIADFIVVDHCNHFSLPSLAMLMAEAGLELVEIDDKVHRGALVSVARKTANAVEALPRDTPRITATLGDAARIAEFWRNAADRVRTHEAGLPQHEDVAIYGAGFYGAFIAASVARPDRIACHLDQNPFLQGKMFNGRPIRHPSELPAAIRAVMVGLNPAHARGIIADIQALSARDLQYFYL
jgi:SAM-dependent methyltransferase